MRVTLARLKEVDQNLIIWYTFPEPEWRNRQTRATQNRVGLAHVGSIPTSGIWFNQGWTVRVHRGVRGRDMCPKAPLFS